MNRVRIIVRQVRAITHTTAQRQATTRFGAARGTHDIFPHASKRHLPQYASNGTLSVPQHSFTHLVLSTVYNADGALVRMCINNTNDRYRIDYPRFAAATFIQCAANVGVSGWVSHRYIKHVRRKDETKLATAFFIIIPCFSPCFSPLLTVVTGRFPSATTIDWRIFFSITTTTRGNR
jgi:hypothetical protein